VAQALATHDRIAKGMDAANWHGVDRAGFANSAVGEKS
jgi:hypothetical protein